MSGPKAFRIVTRAEIVAICRRNLARLDAAIESWTSAGSRNGTIEQTEIVSLNFRSRLPPRSASFRRTPSAGSNGLPKWQPVRTVI
jgi:hypothetical protein